MKRDWSLFTRDAIFEASNEKLDNYDKSRFYKGHLIGKNRNSKVYGVITKDGKFNGIIEEITDKNTVEIYCLQNDIIYKQSDIDDSLFNRTIRLQTSGNPIPNSARMSPINFFLYNFFFPKYTAIFLF